MPSQKPVSGSRECLAHLVKHFKFDNVLDLGCGYFPYYDIFKSKGIEYTGIDVWNPRDIAKLSEQKGIEFINGDILRYDFKGRKFQCVVSSHVIEHVANTEDFVRRLMELTEEGGIICIVYPKMKQQVVGGHVHIFNNGIVYYNLIRCGISCKDWITLSKGYSNCLMGRFNRFEIPQLTYSRGEIELLSEHFPFPAKQDFHGTDDVPAQRL